MTFDPFRDMRDAVPSEPSPDVERRPPAPWIAVIFAVAMVMVIAAGWYFGSTISPSMRADNPSSAEQAR